MTTECYVTCDEGHEHWGSAGAAGLMICHVASGKPARYLLQHRAAETHGGDCWSVPGGALDEGEEPLAGALREALEETTLPDGFAATFDVEGIFTADHGGWAYSTFLVLVDELFEARALSWETGPLGMEWFTREEVDSLTLHGGFRALWESRGDWLT